jgi:hypothetical protein
MQQEDDFFLRQVKKLVMLVATALGKKQPEQLEEAEQAVDDAYGRLLNMDRHTFELLDEKSLALLLGDDQRIRLIAEVMLAEADILRGRGEVAPATRRYQRALGLLSFCKEGTEREALRSSLEARIATPT